MDPTTTQWDKLKGEIPAPSADPMPATVDPVVQEIMDLTSRIETAVTQEHQHLPTRQLPVELRFELVKTTIQTNALVKLLTGQGEDVARAFNAEVAQEMRDFLADMNRDLKAEVGRSFEV